VGRQVVVFNDMDRWYLWVASKNLGGGAREGLRSEGSTSAEAASERSRSEWSVIFG
jgi:hypothetical protein